jgi:hypothetical protein
MISHARLNFETAATLQALIECGREFFGPASLATRMLATYQGFIWSSVCSIGAEDTLMNPANGRSMSKIKFTAMETEIEHTNRAPTIVALSGANIA